jgi:hypothetical protein
MAELEDEKRERFAQMLAQGFKKSKAFRLAGWKPDRGNASRVSREPAIVARVEEIKASLPALVVVPQIDVQIDLAEDRRGEKVTRESMTADIDQRILKAEAAGEWPTVAALTQTRAKLHGLLLQEQAAAEGGAKIPDAELLKKIMEGVKATGAGIEPWQVMRLMGMHGPDGKIAGPSSPATNGHAKPI